MSFKCSKVNLPFVMSKKIIGCVRKRKEKVRVNKSVENQTNERFVIYKTLYNLIRH